MTAGRGRGGGVVVGVGRTTVRSAAADDITDHGDDEGDSEDGQMITNGLTNNQWQLVMSPGSVSPCQDDGTLH